MRCPAGLKCRRRRGRSFAAHLRPRGAADRLLLFSSSSDERAERGDDLRVHGIAAADVDRSGWSAVHGRARRVRGVDEPRRVVRRASRGSGRGVGSQKEGRGGGRHRPRRHPPRAPRSRGRTARRRDSRGRRRGSGSERVAEREQRTAPERRFAEVRGRSSTPVGVSESRRASACPARRSRELQHDGVGRERRTRVLEIQ